MIINLLQEETDSLPIYLNTASSYFRQGIVQRPFGEDFHQILFVLDGEGILNYKNKKTILKKGSAFYTAPNIPVSYKGTHNMNVAFLTVKGDAAAKLAKHFNCRDILLYDNIDVRRYALYINQIIEEFQTHKRSAILSALSYSLYAEFFEQQNQKSDIIDKISIYIDKNYMKKITLKDIASHFGISVSKLCHDFKKQFGRTVFEYILDLRLSHARNIFLSNNDARTKDVSISCGFDDISYFCKAYKHKFGTTPSLEKHKD